ncbi:unnamed protein product [Sphagnum balticum]
MVAVCLCGAAAMTADWAPAMRSNGPRSGECVRADGIEGFCEPCHRRVDGRQSHERAMVQNGDSFTLAVSIDHELYFWGGRHKQHAVDTLPNHRQPADTPTTNNDDATIG